MIPAIPLGIHERTKCGLHYKTQKFGGCSKTRSIRRETHWPKATNVIRVFTAIPS
jgi:hypothetical protein